MSADWRAGLERMWARSVLLAAFVSIASLRRRASEAYDLFFTVSGSQPSSGRGGCGEDGPGW